MKYREKVRLVWLCSPEPNRVNVLFQIHSSGVQSQRKKKQKVIVLLILSYVGLIEGMDITKCHSWMCDAGLTDLYA